ncbi:HPP family protein [Devosia sp. J2-20]|uniref:HPP family protein n=1 Tax=Devosia sp. J2-20 TaxID=3026161 RepID=UPI00249BE4BA|nr:HPP family protein [Devosia sp. J2-20]WDQ98745.1 HPP family protein [Devosia sp. J2-20]
MSSVIPFFMRFVPGLAPVSLGERLRASLGAVIGIVITGAVATLALSSSDVPLLIAPIGASAVLLFAVPMSPLAQPWSIIGGNTIAALIGVTCARYISDPMLAAGLAVGAAIAIMMAMRCLHPPSGAVALTAVLGGPAITAAGYGFVIWPVLINSLLLLAVALAFNNLTGRHYPHLTPAPAVNPHKTADALPSGRLGVSAADISAVLAQHDVVLPVAADQLEDILHRAEMRAYDRRSAGVTCAQVMSRDVLSVGPKTSLREALRYLREHHIKALPVVDHDNRVIGILTQTDLLDKADWGMSATGSGLGWRLRAISNSDRSLKGRVEDVMSTPVKAAHPDTHIAQVVPYMADAGLHHLPVTDDDQRLVGMLTQSDVMAAMYAVSVGETALAVAQTPVRPARKKALPVSSA